MIPQRQLIGGLGNLLFKEAYIYSQYRDGLVPDIYVQDEKHFYKYADEIKARYRSGILGSLSQVAIHVRRGDYVNNDFYVDLLADGYYERAMKEFVGAEFIVFSDDIPFCKTQKVFEGCSFSEGNSEVDDFNLMSSCTGRIIANSSFSWWAAYIAPKTEKVVAPKKWYVDGVARTTLPKEWIQI